jgi:ATP-dependent helicase/nuclease subunit A
MDDHSPETGLDAATRAQIAAADPERSTWLAANAGSGKTRVLTDRVARLLLDGAPPENILCLTYTKAAASEMQNRLFDQLGGWAMLDDAALTQALRTKGVDGPLGAERLDAARRLFASAIEAPGGLKIQTIHAFCAALLRRFPLEAGVPPTFTELDERGAEALHLEVLEAMAEGPDATALDALAGHLSSDESLASLARDVLSRRQAFAAPMDLADALRAHDLPEDFDDARLVAEVLSGGEADLIARIAPVMRDKGGNDARDAPKLEAARDSMPGADALPLLEAAFLTGAGTQAPFTAKVGKLPTKPTRERLDPADLEALNGLMQRVEAARSRRLAQASAQRTAALHAFAAAFLPAVATRKAARGLVDFDDLILKVRDLLREGGVGEWVLYKLDGRIDHILVDEAQDTSPLQWEVIAALAREMTAGSGAREVQRTLFVVGDRKQSIYSFQGADPDAFARLRDDFDARLAPSGGLAAGTLAHSFRSAPAILEAVDATFAAGGAGIGDAPAHVAFKADLPGRVDLWPWVEKESSSEDREWYVPPDAAAPDSPQVRLARAIAGELSALIAAGETIPDGEGKRRPLTSGDVLILVQRRGPLFREIIRACKAEGLPIAGADRLKLTRDLGVRDLLALLAFLSLPEDDLSLAACLRSPLFGWSEDDLYRLAQPRRGYLWAALREEHADSATHSVLRDLRDHTDFLRPYDLLERMLTAHRGRERLVARLGPDCEEAVDALLSEALVYEQADVPSLTGFVEWMRGDEAEIKREAEGAGTRLRVMTVHGAKGLEAPVVILPDCGVRDAPQPGHLLPTAGGWIAWAGATDERPAPVADAAAALQAAQMGERQRLLYVAMTRAQVWLWVCACRQPDKRGESWHAQVAAGLRALGPEEMTMPTGRGLRHATGDWTAPTLASPPKASPEVDALPVWALRDPPAPPAPPVRLSPSGLGGVKALPGDAGTDEDAALRWGRQIHLLLEHLPEYPEASWPRLVDGLLAMGGEPAGPPETEALLAEATRVLTNPALAALFGPEALAEATLTAPLPDGGRLTGTVDRLMVSEERVQAVDFKTNAVVPETPEGVPEGLLRQMGAYDAALCAIYPERTIETALLWTRSGRLMPLPRGLVTAAWDRACAEAGVLDAHVGAT